MRENLGDEPDCGEGAVVETAGLFTDRYGTVERNDPARGQYGAAGGVGVRAVSGV